MFTYLRKKFPTAIIQNHYPTNLEATKIWFTNEAEDEYIGIVRSEITQEETELLHCLFKEIINPSGSINDSPNSMEWFTYLYKNGPMPSNIDGEFRIIQFSMKESLDQLLLKEAFKHLLPLHTILVLQDDNMGLLIEEKGAWNLDEEQLPEHNAYLFGNVLQHFLTKSCSINSFAKLVLKSKQRGEISRWQSRIGVKKTL